MNIDKFIFEKLKSSTLLNSYFLQNSKNGSSTVSYYNYFNFSLAPQDVKYPYIVWQVISGTPENTLSCAPKMDRFNVQFDFYYENRNIQEIDTIIKEIFRILESDGYITDNRGESRDFTTRAFRVSFDYEVYLQRT